MQVLVANAGSSSLKLRILDGEDDVVAGRDLGRLDGSELEGALVGFLADSPPFDAIGHRVVHGGSVFETPVRLDRDVAVTLRTLTDLAPLHNPPALAVIDVLGRLRPDLPHVCCFDTAFHAGMPSAASTYAVPRSWRERWALRRYGFHGLSHSWASRRAGELLGASRGELRLVTAHLGAGGSLAAVAFGRSVDTTMGFTPLEGLVMATRSGSIDPGLLLFVQRHGGMTPDEMERVLEHESGLLGLSGSSGDLRDVIASADRGDADARLAYDVYVLRIRTAVGAMTASMDGIDALVFTGGAGEASARLRADVCRGLRHLAVVLDTSTNDDLSEDGVISQPESGTAVVVVVAREDREIASAVRTLLAP